MSDRALEEPLLDAEPLHDEENHRGRGQGGDAQPASGSSQRGWLAEQLAAMGHAGGATAAAHMQSLESPTDRGGGVMRLPAGYQQLRGTARVVSARHRDATRAR